MSLQNLTDTNIQQVGETEIVNQELLNAQQDMFVTFMALGGLITEESDRQDQAQDIHQMTKTEFCDKLGISRQTFYNWKKIPGIGDRIRLRRREIHSLNRESALFNRAYLIAMTSKDHKAAVEAIKLLQGHFAELDLPIQRQEIKNEGESWASLVERKQRDAVEAEIVNDPQVKEHDRPTNNS